MNIRKILSRWYRLAPFVSIAISVAALAIAGVIYLIQEGWFLWWCAGCLILSVLTFLLIKVMSSKDGNEVNEQEPLPNIAWTALERDAWGSIQSIASKIEQEPPYDLKSIQELAIDVFKTTAQKLHPNKKFASAHFTLPDVLFAVEIGVRDLRGQIVSKVPGSGTIKISQLIWLIDFYQSNGSLFKALWYAYRAFRMGTNPAQALIQEAKSYVEAKPVSGATNFIYGQFSKFIVQEVGRSAIDLYGGRLRADARNLVDSMNDSMPETVDKICVRIAVLGQVNTGKSSLINALLEEVAAPVSELPTPIGSREFRLQTDGRPSLVLIDVPGLDGNDKNEKAMFEAVEKADLILWVSSAVNPARNIDQQALALLQDRFYARPDKKHPAIVTVATHIDRLSPSREWSPPYNIQMPEKPKEINIQNALKAIAADLPFARKTLVPICSRGGLSNYNIDALWSAIALNLDEAKQTALHRGLKASIGDSFSRVGGQLLQGGRFIVDLTWSGLRKNN